MSDDEWPFMAPYLTLMREDAPQREHSLREVLNGLRYDVHAGMQWRMMTHDPPPWYPVDQQTQRWLRAGVFEDRVHGLRMLMRKINDLRAWGRSSLPHPASGRPAGAGERCHYCVGAFDWIPDEPWETL